MGSYPVHSGVRETRRRLEDAGFKGLQMEALVEMMVGMEERLATKEDLAHAQGALRQNIAEVREDLNRLATTVATNTTRIEGLERAMEALRQEVRDRFESFRQEIAAQMEGLRCEMDGLRGEMRTIKWMVGGIFALMVPMVGGIIGIALRLGQG